jgi:hypothetical protein
MTPVARWARTAGFVPAARRRLRRRGVARSVKGRGVPAGGRCRVRDTSVVETECGHTQVGTVRASLSHVDGREGGRISRTAVAWLGGERRAAGGRRAEGGEPDA